MVAKLRKRFIIIAMFSVSIVLIGVLSFINIFYFLQINKNADYILKYLSNNDGRFPDKKSDSEYPISEETPFETRFFTVRTDSNNMITQINMGHIAAILPSQAYRYAEQVMESGQKSGYLGSYKYMVSESDDGNTIIFLDRSAEISGLGFLVVSSLTILGVSLAVIFALLSVLSKKILEPIIQNIEKQKQFITDASHEIKTPLAIISADTDVIEIESGKSEWTGSIKEQIVRLNELIKSMLTLSKMDSEMPDNVITKFNLSALAEQTAEEFTPVAVNEHKTFNIEVLPDIQFTGNKDGVKQLISVFLNNAFKYTNDNGTITLSVFKKGKSVYIDLTNTTDNMPEGDLKRLFDRFYRADKSRSRETGSYGIGLSIAQAVTEQHKGSISAKQMTEDIIRFRAVLNS